MSDSKADLLAEAERMCALADAAVFERRLQLKQREVATDLNPELLAFDDLFLSYKYI